MRVAVCLKHQITENRRPGRVFAGKRAVHSLYGAFEIGQVFVHGGCKIACAVSKYRWAR